MDILNGFPIKLGCFWNKNIFAICSKICAKENNEGNKKVTVFQDKQTFINVVAPSVSGVLRGSYLPFIKAFTMKIYLTHGKNVQTKTSQGYGFSFHVYQEEDCQWSIG